MRQKATSSTLDCRGIGILHVPLITLKACTLFTFDVVSLSWAVFKQAPASSWIPSVCVYSMYTTLLNNEYIYFLSGYIDWSLICRLSRERFVATLVDYHLLRCSIVDDFVVLICWLSVSVLICTDSLTISVCIRNCALPRDVLRAIPFDLVMSSSLCESCEGRSNHHRTCSELLCVTRRLRQWLNKSKRWTEYGGWCIHVKSGMCHLSQN